MVAMDETRTLPANADDATIRAAIDEMFEEMKRHRQQMRRADAEIDRLKAESASLEKEIAAKAAATRKVLDALSAAP